MTLEVNSTQMASQNETFPLQLWSQGSDHHALHVQDT